MVEVRDQVLTIRFSPERFIASIRSSSRASTNGPFLLDLLTASYLASAHARCSGPMACASFGCDNPASALPTASPDAGPGSWTLLRRRAGGRPDSSRYRVSAAERPCAAYDRPCRR